MNKIRRSSGRTSPTRRPRASQLVQHQRDAGLRHQPDEDQGTPQREDRLLRRTLQAEQTSNNAFGVINFSRTRSHPISTTRHAAANAQWAASAPTRSAEYRDASVYNNIDAYIQDNWKVNSRLTLDYGVRVVARRAMISWSRPRTSCPISGPRIGADVMRGRLLSAPCSEQPRGGESVTGFGLGANAQWHRALVPAPATG